MQLQKVASFTPGSYVSAAAASSAGRANNFPYNFSASQKYDTLWKYGRILPTGQTTWISCLKISSFYFL
jgi:hypothetical protein